MEKSQKKSAVKPAERGQRICKAKTALGQPCQGFAMNDSDFCHSHNPDPEVREKFLALVQKKRKKDPILPLERAQKEVNDIHDVAKCLSATIYEVKTRQIAPPVASAVAKLCTVLAQVYRQIGNMSEEEDLNKMSVEEIQKEINKLLKKTKDAETNN